MPDTTTPPPAPSTPTGTPTPVPKRWHATQIALLVFLVLFGVGIGYYVYRYFRPAPMTQTTNTTVNTAGEEDLNVNVPETNTNRVVGSGTSVGTVKWTTAKDVPLVKIYTVNSSDQYAYDPNASAKMQAVGTVTDGPFKGGTVIRYSYQEEGPVLYPVYSYLIQQGDKYTLLLQNTGQLASYDGGPQLDQSIVTIDTEHELLDLAYPETLVGPKPRQILELDDSVNAEFSATGLTKVFTDATYGPVYSKPATLGSNLDYNNNAAVDAYLAGTVFQTRNGFYLEAPDGSVRVYTLKVDILADLDPNTGAQILQATWDTGAKNTVGYIDTALSGCGSLNYINVVQPSEVSITKDLKQTGTTAKGDPLYEFKDTNAAVLKQFYNSTVYNDPSVEDFTQHTQKPYAEFVTMHPMVFWTDPFGRLIQLTSNQFTTLAECGKPVIYLYPTTTTTVNVQLAPHGGFTKTEPAYNSGWNVVAQPNGHLTNLADGQAYPYLFWEGRGGIYTDPTQGFTVAQADVHSFLIEKLHQLGLNDQETNDFIAFWEPRMQGSPYYVVSFLGNQVMNRLAPLTVTPTPETVIRVLMDFKPVDRPVTLPTQHLTMPQRTGFTVVEWGGVLR